MGGGIYFDFERLWKINSAKAYFIIRAKKSISYERMYSKEIDRSNGLRCDQIIKLKNFYSKKYYPEKLRRVKYYDAETNQYYVYLTNNLDIDAKKVAISTNIAGRLSYSLNGLNSILKSKCSGDIRPTRSRPKFVSLSAFFSWWPLWKINWTSNEIFTKFYRFYQYPNLRKPP